MANDSRSENPPRENCHPDAAEPARLPEGNARSGEPPESSVRLAEAAEEIEDAGPKNRFEDLAARFRRPKESARDHKAGDRLRGALILAATAIGCVFLFFGLFTTSTDSSKKERKTQPSLGRPQATATAAETANRSVVPQLNVTQQPNEETGELTEKDLLGTMRNRGTSIPTENVPKPVATAKQTLPKRSTSPALNSIDFEDPALAEAYRRQGLTPPPRRATEVTGWNAAIAEYQAKQNAKAAPAAPVSNPSEALRKSSFVYVRTSLGNVTGGAGVVPAIQQRKQTPLLAQGTKLVARLQYAVSSAAKAPVVAVIEYNYEQNGDLIIPAGTKAYGTLSQVTPQGWVNIKFDALQYPNGDQEKIDGAALSMEQGVLKGFVNGRNTGKKFLTRTLTGIGTIAALAVGGRGLGGQIDNSILLRERLSSNVAMAGEQELAMLAYQQNIVVTVPANTRFYLVLNEPGINSPASFQETTTPAGNRALLRGEEVRTTGMGSPSNGSPLAGMSQQEMQELISIRNEMREMNRLIKMQNPPSAPQPEPEK
ncbi:MAG: hypothetical protein NTW28_00295 [Candidatus Solibacter sp.]|nr:hypothetical protein [Candidatus Solibacter sp.]